MTSKASRSEKMLAKIGDQLGITEPGRNWLTIALDPFHDIPVRVDGYPDVKDTPSIVQFVKQSMTISCPPGVLASAGTWDCHIVDYPYFPVNGVSVAASSSVITYVDGVNASNPEPVDNNLYQPTSGSVVGPPISGLTAIGIKSGFDTSYNTVAQQMAAGNNVNINQLILPTPYNLGEYRIIAKGFEVHNTTPMLNINGSVAVYRTPQPSATAATTFNIYNTTTTVINHFAAATVQSSYGPPGNIQSTVLLPNTKVWDAKEGCYVISALHESDLPVASDAQVLPYLYQNDIGLSPPFNYSPGSHAVPTLRPLPHYQSEFDISGAYFTGLSTQTTLVVNYNIVVERFPSLSDLDLIVLADPSPEYDEIAIKMYSHLVRNLPIGCPVKFNGLGDWFSGALENVSNFVAPVLSAIPHPLTQGIGMGLGAVNAAVKNNKRGDEEVIVVETPAPATGAAATPSPYVNMKQSSKAIENSLRPHPRPTTKSTVIRLPKMKSVVGRRPPTQPKRKK